MLSEVSAVTVTLKERSAYNYSDLDYDGPSPEPSIRIVHLRPVSAGATSAELNEHTIAMLEAFSDVSEVVSKLPALSASDKAAAEQLSVLTEEIAVALELGTISNESAKAALTDALSIFYTNASEVLATGLVAGLAAMVASPVDGPAPFAEAAAAVIGILAGEYIVSITNPAELASLTADAIWGAPEAIAEMQSQFSSMVHEYQSKSLFFLRGLEN